MSDIRARALNPQVLLEMICYGFFGVLAVRLVRSGQYLDYVTPRMKPYLYFAAIVMLLWAGAALGRILRPQHKVRCAHCFVLVIPILLLLLPHSPLTVSALADGYVGGLSVAGQAGKNIAAGDTDLHEAQSDLPGLDITRKRIVVPDDHFGLWMNEIYSDMSKYAGYTIKLTGFVFTTPETLKENKFVPARLMMACCSADLAPSGLLCHYDKAAELKKGAWVTVEGVLFIGTYEYAGRQYDDPQISLTKITPAKPVEGYVYPY